MGTLITQALSGNQHDRSLKIIAKSLFKELKANGFESRHIVSLSTELISLLTSELRQEDPGTPSAQ